MGLINWKNNSDGLICKYEFKAAKNYLSKNELNKLKHLTNLFLDISEDEVTEEKVMTMNDWIEVTNNLLRYRKKEKIVVKYLMKKQLKKQIMSMKNLE